MTATSTITNETVRQAALGASIINNRELFVSHDGKVPQECVDAAKLIQADYEQFRQLVWKRLEQLPLTKKYFGKLVRARLKQKGILASPIISVIFDDYQTLEQRLNNVKSVSGIESLKNEYRGSEDFLQGGITDAVMRNLLAEITVLDFLIKLGFVNIRKISRKDKPHIDIAAEREGQGHAIDATRKQEVSDWEVEPSTNLEDCKSHKNQLEIRRLIMQTLEDKNKQFCRALHAHTISDSVVKVVAIKTSDYGFAECIEQATRIAQELLSEKDRWQHIDCVWLLPNVDVSQSRWVYKQGAG
jgi:hypothetical protein